MMNIWKAKNNYGLELKEVLFDDITWGGVPCRKLPVWQNLTDFMNYWSRKN